MFQVGDIVRSKINKVYNGTYTIIKVKKSVVWVKVNSTVGENLICKNVKFSVLEKVG